MHLKPTKVLTPGFSPYKNNITVSIVDTHIVMPCLYLKSKCFYNKNSNLSKVIPQDL